MNLTTKGYEESSKGYEQQMDQMVAELANQSD